MQHCMAADVRVANLEEACREDPAFLELHKDDLLMPGWAGVLRPSELDYIKSELHRSPSLRRRWGFRPSAKRFSEFRIKHVAMYGL